LQRENLSEIDLFIRFTEIIKGYSTAEYRGSPIFIKHLGCNEKAIFDLRYKEFHKIAVEKGIPTEEQSLETAKKDSFWTENDEVEIEKIQSYIERLGITKKNLFKSLEIKEIQKVINEQKEKLIAKLTERRSVLGKTVEEYASNRSSDYIIYESFYKDEELKQKFFSIQDFEDMSYEELVEFILLYNSFMQDFKELNIQKTVLMDFFNQYFLVIDYPTEFFGLPMVKLTDFQVRIIMYGKIFKSIFDHTENIPDKIRKDPEALLAYQDKSTAKKEFESKHSPKGDVSASMVFGATKEDMEENNAKGTSLNKLMKEKKVLNMEELMKLHGEG
jgi:hypothetical protein